MAKHTPGPWHCIGGAVYRDGNAGEPTGPIAFMCRDERATLAGIHPTERDANARLIAAAPDLLAACVALLVEYDSMNAELRHIGKGRPESSDGAHPDSAGQAARSAIADAKGES